MALFKANRPRRTNQVVPLSIDRVLVTPPGGNTAGLIRKRNQTPLMQSSEGDFIPLRGSGLPYSYPHPRGHGTYHQKNLNQRTQDRYGPRDAFGGSRSDHRVLVTAPGGRTPGQTRRRTQAIGGLGRQETRLPHSDKRRRQVARIAERKRLIGVRGDAVLAANTAYRANPTQGNLRGLKKAKAALGARIATLVADKRFPGKGATKFLNEGAWITSSRLSRLVEFGRRYHYAHV